MSRFSNFGNDLYTGKRSIDFVGRQKTWYAVSAILLVLATIGLFLSFGYWNDWFQAMLYINDTKLNSLQALLTKIMDNVDYLSRNAATMGVSSAELARSMPKEGARMAIATLIVIPIACAYPFFQRYFISGLTVGAVKG